MSIKIAQLPQVDDNSDIVDVELVAAADAERAGVERFIRVAFRRAYGAQIKYFMPYLLCMKQNASTLAALGINPARDGELFLESYLDNPIENVLATALNRPIDRERIVEVGNLASAKGGGARALIVALTAYFSGADYEWVVFTATPQVRNNFAKLGIDVIPLVDADKNRLGSEQNNWGSYYDQHPKVVVANIGHGIEQLLHSLEEQKLFPGAAQLWQDAHLAGQRGDLLQPPAILRGSLPQALFNESDEVDK